MNQKTIGIIALVCSPFLAIDLTIHGGFNDYNSTSLGGLFNLIYMTGWLLSVLALYQMHSRSKKIVKTIFLIQILFLVLAEISNVWLIIEPRPSNTLYTILDLFWPISNAFMFFTGLTIVLSKQLRGWRRFIPLFVGLWFPTGLCVSLAVGRTPLTVYFISIYSAIAWLLLALTVYTNRQIQTNQTIPLAQAA